MVDVMAIGAHPDDVEFGCGGILAKMASEGKRLVIVDLTLGEMGTYGTPSQRRAEAHQAAHLIGAERVNLEMGDCSVVDSIENREKLVSVIREYQPKLVLATMWKGEQNHPDHLACGQMARHACRLARFKNILPGVKPHTPGGILHYTQKNFDPPHFIIDISDHVEMWKKMILAHDSQMQTKPYLEWNLKKAAFLGTLIGVEYAQGLAAGNPVFVDDVMSISQGTLEL